MGRATPEGTRRFAARFGSLEGHFRRPDALEISSLALGMRSGEPGGVDDLLYRSAVPQCLEGGVNTFATALSERIQQSERNLGGALARAFREGIAQRDEVVVITKGGYLTIDPEVVTSRADARRYLVETYVDTGLVDPDHVSQGVHCLQPDFLRDQIQRSLRNLGLETVDYYLLEEPELLLDETRKQGAEGFRQGMMRAFEALEQAVDEGQIAAYGLATWDGLLRPHTDRHHLAILDLFDWALEAGGADHHLRAIQLPYSVAMGEALRLQTQLVPPGGTDAILGALRNTGTLVLAAAPLVQGRALGHLPRSIHEAFPGLASDAQRCLQFARSTPGVTTAVVGMREPDHIDENLALAATPPATPQTIQSLFSQTQAA
jgi:aryl-alcohol dehydrogenase-like predicted oxidoreductase